MAMTARVSNMGGKIVAEKRGGTYRLFQHDALGSVISVFDEAGNVTDTYEYWPYGEVRTSSGSSSNPWKFCGAWGYYTDVTSRQYVRARTLRNDLGCWMTVDPLWPQEAAFSYASASPAWKTDPDGRQVMIPIIPILLCLADDCDKCPKTVDPCKYAVANTKKCSNTNVTAFVACCNGTLKVCFCPTTKKIHESAKECIRRHENFHKTFCEQKPHTCECEKNGLPSKCGTLASKTQKGMFEGECDAYAVELKCLKEKGYIPPGTRNNFEWVCSRCANMSSACNSAGKPMSDAAKEYCKSWKCPGY